MGRCNNKHVTQNKAAILTVLCRRGVVLCQQDKDRKAVRGNFSNAIIISSTKPFVKSVLKTERFNEARQCQFEAVTQQNIFSNNSDDTASARECSLRKLILLSPKKDKSPFSCIPIFAFLQQHHNACLCSIQHSHDPTSLILFLSQHSHVLCFH